MSIKELYYRFKYRPKKGQAGATGIIMSKKNNANDFNERLEKMTATVVPQYRSNADVLEYLKSKYNLVGSAMSEGEFTSFKVNYIMNKRPEVLTIHEIKLPKDREPTRKQFLEFSENSQKRFEEARKYPFEKLNLDISSYYFEHSFNSGKTAHIDIVFENKNDDIFVMGKSNILPDDEDMKSYQNMLAEITIFKGITQKDIDERNNKYIAYCAAVIELEKE